jgi:hypothetical protein
MHRLAYAANFGLPVETVALMVLLPILLWKAWVAEREAT